MRQQHRNVELAVLPTVRGRALLLAHDAINVGHKLSIQLITRSTRLMLLAALTAASCGLFPQLVAAQQYQVTYLDSHNTVNRNIITQMQAARLWSEPVCDA